MSQKVCCVPGCLSTNYNGAVLHKFPHPKTNPEKFASWVSNVGGEVLTMADMSVYNTRRVCRKHFEKIHLYASNKLCPLAIPVLHIPGSQPIEQIQAQATEPSMNIEYQMSNSIFLNSTALSESIQPSTSGTRNQSVNLISGSLHSFPNPKSQIERFEKWKLVLDQADRNKSPNFIYQNIRFCDNHFEKYFILYKKVTQNSVPTLNLDLPKTTTETPVAATSATELPSTRLTPSPASLGALDLPTQLTDPLSFSDHELDHELLETLGDDPLQNQTMLYGKYINNNLAVRMEYTATNGLSKEHRRELLGEYMPPENCKLIDAPALNPEIIADVSDAMLKQDEDIKNKQKQLAAAATCVAGAVTSLMSTNPKNTALIKILMDGLKLLCDIQYNDSLTRRGFILNNLKKELKNQLKTTKIDKMLFSENLTDTIKANKTKKPKLISNLSPQVRLTKILNRSKP